MKKIFLIFLLASFYATALSASESIVTFRPTEDIVDKNLEYFVEHGSNLVEKIKLINKNYPDEKIEESFEKELAQYYATDEIAAQKLEERIRQSIKLYRYAENKYNMIKEKLLIPDAPPLILEEEDVPKLEKMEYVDVKDGVLVTNNFLKIVPYSSNKRDFEALEKRKMDQIKQESAQTEFDAIRQQIAKLEIKKYFKYGKEEANPFTGLDGQGHWQIKDKTSARIITLFSKTGNSEKIQAVIHFDVPKKMGIKALQSKPKITFKDSKNLKSWQVYYPTPSRFFAKDNVEDAYYFGNFAIPVIFELEDMNKELLINSQIELSLCSELECKKLEFSPSITLENGNPIQGATANFIRQSFNFLPLQENPNIKISNFEKDENGNILLIAKTDLKSKNLFVFLEDNAKTIFYRPTIKIDGDKITAIFKTNQNIENMIGQKFDITISVDNRNSIKQEHILQNTSIFQIKKNSLSFAMIILAVLGGIILNCMPCVFPALSLKLLSIISLGLGAKKQIRKDFLQTIGGIFASFAIITIILIIIKMLGQAIGWGMQFQNIYFIIFMIFVICFFLAFNLNMISFSFKGSQVFYGVFIVMLATPCTAPYLATAVGFAMTSTYTNLAIIMMSIALGLSMPYILVCAYPKLITCIPKPGKWMLWLQIGLNTMLVLTIIWLISIIGAQSSVTTTILVSTSAILSLLLLAIRNKSIQFIEIESLANEQKQHAIKIVNYVIFALIVMMFASSLIFANKKNVLTETSSINQTQIDEYLKQNKIVLLKVGADWCLTCKYNEAFAFSNQIVKFAVQENKLKVISIDWTDYNEQVLEYMKKFGRTGIPFYVLFSPSIPDGMVLPEVLSEKSMNIFLN